MQRWASVRTESLRLRRLEVRFSLALKALARAVVNAYLKAVPELLDHPAPTQRHDAWTEDIISRIELVIAALIGDHVLRAFAVMSRGVVNQVTPFDTGIQGAIDHAREQNLLLIDKLARGYGNDVREVFRDPAVFGMRVEDVRRLLKKQADITERHAALIARDQTLKLNADITRIRQQNAGIESYRWSTSQDERVRPAHAE